MACDALPRHLSIYSLAVVNGLANLSHLCLPIIEIHANLMQSSVQQSLLVWRLDHPFHCYQEHYCSLREFCRPPTLRVLHLSGQPADVVQNDVAYSADIQKNITILASKYASTDDGVIQGLLYVPDLDANDPCVHLESEFIPKSAVRQADLPPSDFNLIALVPWYSPNCTKSYMRAAAADPLRGFITYVPGNSTDKPPAVEDKVWNLHDHGAWTTQSKFPVYAVSGTVGASMMAQLGLYSGNVSSVPYGKNITALYSPSVDDYVRIWTEIHVTTPSTLPTIWVFILVCIAVLIGFVALVSCLMHYVQRRRRSSLQRRVISGEVNLEAMNIKRVRVPIEHVEKFPLFTYNYEPKATSPPASPMTPCPAYTPMHTRDPSRGSDGFRSSTPAPAVSEKALASPTARSTITGITNTSTSTDYQPRCTICLEDYDNRISIIRELPCGHIYHPECIDEYLSENSSLCPQCKASMLPKGYCPQITNAMVRRERAVRRLRGQVTIEEGEMVSGDNWRTNMKKKLFRPSNHPSDAVQETSTRPSPTEETRMRMRSLAGGELDDAQSFDERPAWKRATRTVFPGFG